MRRKELEEQAETKENTRLTLALQKMGTECRKCHPLTPLECADCRIWKLKNELLELNGKVAQNDYRNTLLNTLKNRRRLFILEALSKNAFTIAQLQKELKKHNHRHSQKTILNEYVEPLVTAGLITANSSRYRTTTLGCEIGQLLIGVSDVETALPPHSECYEERLIETLFEAPKTYEELQSQVSVKSLSRILSRLQKTNLIAKDDEGNYIFYFKTRRNPEQEKLSSTEKRVYDNIAEEGVTAEALAKKTGISLRRTYKYLRKLRGKKLVFKRKRPKNYGLTAEGKRYAELLQKMQTVLRDFASASAEFTSKFPGIMSTVSVSDSSKSQEHKPLQILAKQK